MGHDYDGAPAQFDHKWVLNNLKPVLENPEIKKIGQNIKYDWTILERFGFKVNNIVGDTMLAASLLYPEFPKGLDFLTSVYTDHPYYKDEGKEFDPRHHDKSRLYLYNAKDSLVTHQIYSKQLEELEEKKLTYLYESRVMPLMSLYKETDDTGLLVDTAKRDFLVSKYKNILELNKATLSSWYLNTASGRNW